MSADNTIIDAQGQEHPIEFTHVTWGKPVMEDGSEPTPEWLEYSRKRHHGAVRRLRANGAQLPVR